MSPYVQARLAMLGAEAELKAATLELRRDSNKSLGAQSTASRLRLAAERDAQLKIAAEFQRLLEISVKEDS